MKNKGLIIGGLVLLAVAGLGIYLYTKNKSQGDETTGSGEVSASTKQNRVIVTRS